MRSKLYNKVAERAALSYLQKTLDDDPEKAGEASTVARKIYDDILKSWNDVLTDDGKHC